MYIIYIYNFFGKRKKKKKKKKKKNKKRQFYLDFQLFCFCYVVFVSYIFFWKFLAEYDALPRLFSEIRRFTIFLFSLYIHMLYQVNTDYCREVK